MTKKRKWSHDEVHQWLQKNNKYFYTNKEDANLFIRKRYGVAWTLNWGNPLSWIILSVIIVAVILAMLV